MSDKKGQCNKTRILSVTREECICNEVFITIIFKPSLDIKYHLIKWIESLEFPVEQIDERTYKYSEYLTYSKEVERLLNLLNTDKINSPYFIQILKELNKHWN